MRNKLKPRLIQIISTLTFSFIVLSPSHAVGWALSYGINNLAVEGARPLDRAPDGSTSYTPGVQIALHGKSDSAATFQQSGYFKVFVDWDQDELDPDHIPIWFMGEYRGKMELVSFSQNTSLKILLDADSKANTVSSVERTVKLFAGISAEHNTKSFSMGLKTSFGLYFLEIDDDVPKTRGYVRDDFRNSELAYSIAADTQFALGDTFKLSLLAQTWRASGEWLENQYKLQLDYDSNDWVEDSTFVVSLLRSEYNLSIYQRSDISVPILPWNEDTLLQAFIIVPWEF